MMGNDSLKSLKEVSSIYREGEVEEENGNFCFVIMSFSGNPIIESYYKLAVEPTVKKFNLSCIRIDEENFTGLITEQIKKRIESARIVIVDLTEDRPNCYFELGYAVAKNKDFILQRLIAPGYESQFEFDIKDYPHILYTTIADLKRKLSRKLKALLNE